MVIALALIQVLIMCDLNIVALVGLHNREILRVRQDESVLIS